MSAEIISAVGGILTVRVTGRLAQSEVAAAQQQAAAIRQQWGKMRILVLADGFQGWEQGDDWSDLSFQEENDPFIEKIAIVGEKEWEDLVSIFVGKWLRDLPIEFFEPAELAAARAWLTADP